jgi:hypothetical protein
MILPLIPVEVAQKKPLAAQKTPFVTLLRCKTPPRFAPFPNIPYPNADTLTQS